MVLNLVKHRENFTLILPYLTILPFARFEIFTAVKIQTDGFWVTTPRSLCCGRTPTFHSSMLPPSSVWRMR